MIIKIDEKTTFDIVTNDIFFDGVKVAKMQADYSINRINFLSALKSAVKKFFVTLKRGY